MKNPSGHDIIKMHANACIIRIQVAKENRMEAYTSFAEVYDTFMDNIPYEQWADREYDGITGKKGI